MRGEHAIDEAFARFGALALIVMAESHHSHGHVDPRVWTFCALAALGAAPMFIHWQTLETMIAVWSTDGYRHGFLVPFMSLWALWQSRDQYTTLRANGSWLALGGLVALTAALLVARAVDVQILEHLAVALMASVLPLAVLGWRTFQKIWFPFAFMLIAVPMGEMSIPYLMSITANIAQFALGVFDVPVLRDGMIFQLPGGVFEVADLCAGLNFLTTAVALSAFVAYEMFRTPWKGAALVLGAALVAVVCNGLRAGLVMMIASASDMKWLAGQDHIYFGWVVFVLSMVLVYWIASAHAELRVAGQRRDVE